jgi:hypothetical protein
MPNALLLAAAGQYPRAQGRRGTTHPRAIPSSVRDWLGADHGTDRQRRFLIAPTTSSSCCDSSYRLIVARQSTRLDHSSFTYPYSWQPLPNRVTSELPIIHCQWTSPTSVKRLYEALSRFFGSIRPRYRQQSELSKGGRSTSPSIGSGKGVISSHRSCRTDLPDGRAGKMSLPCLEHINAFTWISTPVLLWRQKSSMP